MDNETRKIPISRFSGENREKTEDTVTREFHITISLNGSEMITLPCSPVDLDSLAIGYLVSEGFISGKADIEKILVNEKTGTVQVETADDKQHDDKQPEIKVDSRLEISAGEVYGLMDKFVRHSTVFEATGGVHSAALCDRQNIIIFKEDIGRNNAIDKLFGECILKDIPVDERVIVVSCRMSSEILMKIARRKIPVIISKSPPTDLGVRLADEMGITLLGFVRGKRMNAYAHDWRIT
ncbi:formate dehydrogenase accessory sulfurtransferase FdhD [Chloroflexota bacterium]